MEKRWNSDRGTIGKVRKRFHPYQFLGDNMRSKNSMWGVLMSFWLLACSQNNNANTNNPSDKDSASTMDTEDETNTSTTDQDTDNTDTNQSCTQDYEGHDGCRELYGDMYYCGPTGECIEALGCEALSCCLPGAQGDNWCQATFGTCSECVPGESDGFCSPLECSD